MMEPSEKSFQSPTSAVAAQSTTILSRRPAHSAMGCDHLDALTLGQDDHDYEQIIHLI